MYIDRDIDEELFAWKRDDSRKPLLLRGARQVGKSTVVRSLGERFDYFLELNFEEQRSLHTLFEGDLDPEDICEKLSVLYNTPIEPGRTLLFFDEIQACPNAISALRFFYEKYAALHLIAAGSLLEFALGDLPSFGVGRVRSIFMYPLSFDEYLRAVGELKLLNFKRKASPTAPLPEAFHDKLMEHLKRFLLHGGMPEVVRYYVEHPNDLRGASRLLTELMAAFRADFSKYKERVSALRISEVFDGVVAQSGAKFIYSKAGIESNVRQVKEALDLLIMSGLVIPVRHTAANALPLGAEINPKRQKMLVLDTGLLQNVLGAEIAALLLDAEYALSNKGAIAEIFAGLEMVKNGDPYRPAELYYWHREASGSNAEVDYVVQKGTSIVPVEVKSGRRGAMQSMFRFISEKKSNLGVRISAENYGTYEKVELWPLYAVGDFITAKD